MIHRNCLKALDKSLRDIMCVDQSEEQKRIFGGKMVLLGGDFWQILPVIPFGSKQDIIDASICKSTL